MALSSVIILENVSGLSCKKTTSDGVTEETDDFYKVFDNNLFKESYVLASGTTLVGDSIYYLPSMFCAKNDSLVDVNVTVTWTDEADQAVNSTNCYLKPGQQCLIPCSYLSANGGSFDYQPYAYFSVFDADGNQYSSIDEIPDVSGFLVHYGSFLTIPESEQ